jgi:exonuclease III
MISASLLAHLDAATILSDVYGSDHCPVAVEINL